MTQAEISDAISSAVGRNIRPSFGYYRQSNGWVTISPITTLERVKYMEEGWEHLAKYGSFDMTPYVASHPLEGLFMFGGAKELPVEQVLQTGLYLDPPLVPQCKQHMTQFHRGHTQACWEGARHVEFPQLAGVPDSLLHGFKCEFCARVLPTAEARAQHQSVAHKEPLGNVQLGRTLGDTLASVMGQREAAPANDETSALRRRVAELEAQQAKTQANRERMAKVRAKRKSKV